ncbi:MAG: TIGR03960 family B12-binding radical SAM protein, partial [Ruminiclostridium sp.]|nr:TIGR03960 family B12-binding radical SAM protein [Ruminiclostridium sp.]
MYKEKLDQFLLQVQKPSRYIGGELNSVTKNPADVSLRFAFCFPDTYDIGMSHLGMKILYSLINDVPEYWCERVFMPLPDMEEKMRENEVLLYGLESLEPIRDFDMIGFTLQYELCYTNIPAMLDLAGLPVFSRDRESLTPIVCAGGPCVCNAEPVADFFDLCILGEGEEVNLELMRLLERCKAEGCSKAEFLRRAAQIEGIYVPSLYEVQYHEDGTVRSITPRDGASATVTKRIVRDFDKTYYPESFVVPFSEIVHDRAVVEVLRGCIRGCRFCQAGYLYRPFREKSTD